MSKIILTCTDDQFHELHVAVDRARKSSTNVVVDKEALRRLLHDHSLILGKFKKGDYQ